MILMGAIFSVVLDLLQFAPLIGIAVALFSYGYFGAFYLDIISTTMTDRDEVPDWPSFSSFIDDILSPFIRLVGLVLISFLPVFALLFAVLAGPLGPVAANVVALGACALANTAANRRLTFALRGRHGRGRSYAAGTALAVLPLVATLGVLGLLGAVGITSLSAQLVALTATNALATLGRFLALRHWVFRADAPTSVDERAAA